MTTKAEEKAGEERCAKCEGLGYLDSNHCGFDDCIHQDQQQRCRRCNGTGRQPAEPAASEGEREEPMQRRKTVEQMKAAGRHVSAGRAPFVTYPYETLESVRETYWAERCAEAESALSALSASQARVGELERKHRTDLLSIQESLAPIRDAKEPWPAADIANEVAGYVHQTIDLEEKLSAATAENERLRSKAEAIANSLDLVCDSKALPKPLRKALEYTVRQLASLSASAAPREKGGKV